MTAECGKGNNFMRAIYILWLRQLKRYFRSKARMLGSIGQPLLFLVAMGFGFGPIYQQARGENYLQFLAPGIIAMSILFTAMFSGTEVIWDRQFGFLKETLAAPVSRFNIMLGRTLGGATTAILQGVIVFTVSLMVGFRPDWAYLPVALIFMFLIAVLFTAFGTAIASLMEDMHAFPLIMNFIIMPVFFLSGALFPLDGIPAGIKSVILVNPMYYGVHGIRSALTYNMHWGLLGDMGILAVISLLVIAVGGWLFSKVQV
jgi:ABC-2 type transport system permease protein